MRLPASPAGDNVGTCVHTKEWIPVGTRAQVPTRSRAACRPRPEQGRPGAVRSPSAGARGLPSRAEDPVIGKGYISRRARPAVPHPVRTAGPCRLRTVCRGGRSTVPRDPAGAPPAQELQHRPFPCSRRPFPFT